MEEVLPRAIENGDLKLAFQPIVDARSQRLHSLEVLTRWYLPGDDLVPAEEIIELVERLDLLDPFHVWLINTSIEQLHHWRQSVEDLRFSLNIPANQSHSKLILEEIKCALSTYGISASQIELEITETTLMQRPALSSKPLKNLRDEGVRIAVDDFGTGYSSMAYLTNLPLDTLKIDKQFFIEEGSRLFNRKVAQAMTTLGHALGLKVVAEGIETERELKIAQEIGCDYLQGFYFAKPALGGMSWENFTQQFNHINLKSGDDET